jgi:hypothetical protein
MKIGGWCVLLALASGAGCVQLPPLSDTRTAPPASIRPVSPVTADQVTETNAREKAAALRQELDREAEADAAAPSKAPAVKILP